MVATCLMSSGRSKAGAGNLSGNGAGNPTGNLPAGLPEAPAAEAFEMKASAFRLSVASVSVYACLSLAFAIVT
jgi:hypothetical protein